MIRDLDFSLNQLGQTKAFIGSFFFFYSVVEVITANTTQGLHLGRERCLYLSLCKFITLTHNQQVKFE